MNLNDHFMNKNGRIDIITQQQLESNDLIQKSLLERQDGFEDALNGGWQNTNLSRAFFSDKNIKIVQNGIRAGVYEMSKGMYNVGYQDTTIIKIIMRNTFLEYAKHVPKKETEEIKMLNDLVLEYCIKTVYNEAVAYVKYKNDVSMLPVPGDLPSYTNTKGDNSLEYKQFF